MNRLSISLAVLSMTVLFAAPAKAEDQTLATVSNGRTTIEFKAAGTNGIDMNKLRPWSEFANGHPDIAKQLAYKPALISNDAYASKHPELQAFFSTHPDIREAMIENPGNFVAIPPRPGE